MRKRLNMLLATLTMVGAFVGVSAPALAASSPLLGGNPTFAADFKSEACSGISSTGGSCGKNSGSDTINHVMKVAINLFSIIVGFAAVLVIIISGLRFITSAGDPGTVSTARNGILYAVVGLVLVAMAQTIVHFVLGRVN